MSAAPCPASSSSAGGCRLLSVDEFYNTWAESFFFRLLVDVRKKDVFVALQNHASMNLILSTNISFGTNTTLCMAVHYDPTQVSLEEFIEQQTEECPLFDKVIFYDQQPFHLSKNLKKIASLIQDDGKFHKKTICILEGIESVKKKYEFIWQGKEEEVAYPSLILDDFLYLGDEECSLDEDVITNLGITHVLSVVPVNGNSFKFAPQVEYCQCPIDDLSTLNIEKYFARAIEFIDGAKNSKKAKKRRVLVHCMAGVSRSATLVVVYIMHSMQVTLRDAYMYVLTRRPVIHPNQGFLQQLISYEKSVLSSNSINLCDFDKVGIK